MPVRKETIGQQIARIKASRKYRDIDTGMMYDKPADLRRGYKKLTLVGLFVSDDNTALVRPHVFESDEPRKPVEWEAWLAEHYGKILRDNILPGMEIRTGKQWRLYRIIGWLANDNSGLVRTKTHKQRNKTKPQRRANGRNRARRG